MYMKVRNSLTSTNPIIYANVITIWAEFFVHHLFGLIQQFQQTCALFCGNLKK